MTPHQYYISADSYHVERRGWLFYSTSGTSLYLRPAISLIKEIKYTDGDGTVDNPYIIEE